MWINDSESVVKKKHVTKFPTHDLKTTHVYNIYVFEIPHINYDYENVKQSKFF